MGMYVYKMFNSGLVCRGYQFKIGVNECEHANCVKNGFHAAENPLDCLSYYSSFDSSECWLCYADGDIHEDGSDSKISCTRLEILRRLNKEEYITAAMEFIVNHPKRPLSCHVSQDKGIADSNGFVVVCGRDPIAAGRKLGDLLGYVMRDKYGNVTALSLYKVGSGKIKKNMFYDINGDALEWEVLAV